MSSMTRSQKGFNTCMQCRSRKVRCDGRRDTCRNCERLNFPCSFGKITSNSLDIELQRRSNIQPPRRLRAPRACDACREQKVRCSGELPACQRCARRALQCDYRSTRRPSTVSGFSLNSAEERSGVGNQIPRISIDQTVRSVALLSDPTNGDICTIVKVNLPDDFEIQSAITNFFQKIHSLPAYSFLHETSTKYVLKIGKLNPALIFAMCALNHQCNEADLSEPSQCTSWINASEELIFRQLSQPSISHLQALMLIIRYHLEYYQLARSFMLISLATRIAFGLRLNYEHDQIPFYKQESRRRLMWSIFYIEKMWSGGLAEFTLCPEGAIHLQLPSREEYFECNTPCQTEQIEITSELSQPRENVGLLAHCIRATSIRGIILQNTRRIWSNTNVSPEFLVESARDFEKGLFDIKSRVEVSALFSIENLNAYSRTRWLSRYLQFHLSWHQCHCDVYRTFLPGYQEAASTPLLEQVDQEFSKYAKLECHRHVSSMADIFSAVLNLDIEFPPLDMDIVVCAYHCTRLLLYMSCQEPFIAEASFREKAYLSLDAVKKFSGSSKLTASIICDIEKLLTRGTSSPEITENPGEKNDEKKQAFPSITPAAQSRQRLAKHSLIRRANFIDDSSMIVSDADDASQSQRLNSRHASIESVIPSREQPVMSLSTSQAQTSNESMETEASVQQEEVSDVLSQDLEDSDSMAQDF